MTEKKTASPVAAAAAAKIGATTEKAAVAEAEIKATTEKIAAVAEAEAETVAEAEEETVAEAEAEIVAEAEIEAALSVTKEKQFVGTNVVLDLSNPRMEERTSFVTSPLLLTETC